MEENPLFGDPICAAGFADPRVLSSALDSGIRRNDGGVDGLDPCGREFTPPLRGLLKKPEERGITPPWRGSR